MRRILTLLLCAIPILLAACTSGDTAASEDGVFASMLASVPDEEIYRDVVMVDVERMRALAGIEPPGGVEGEQPYATALFGWLDENDLPATYGITMSADWLLGIAEGGDLLEASARTSRSLGFGFRDVDGFLAASRRPPFYFHMITGDFEPGAVEEHLAACDECPPPEATREVQDATIYSWGDGLRQDLTDRLGPPIFDSLGRGGSLAVLDHRVIRAVDLDLATIGVRGVEGGATLGADEDWAALGAALDALDLVAAHATDQVATADRRETAPGGIDPRLLDDVWATDGRYAMVDPYALFGAGVGLDAGAPFTAFVLLFEDERTAEANVERVRARFARLPFTAPGGPEAWEVWPDLFDSFEVEASRRTVVLTAYGRAMLGPYLVWEPLFLIDPAAQ